MSCSGTLAWGSILLGPALQGCDSSAGAGSGCQCCTGVTLTGTPQQEAEKWGWQQFSPFFRDSHMLHQVSSRNHSKASTEAAGIWGIQKEKKEADMNHAVPTLSPNWKIQL